MECRCAARGNVDEFAYGDMAAAVARLAAATRLDTLARGSYASGDSTLTRT